MSALIVFPLQNGVQEADGQDAFGSLPKLPKPTQRWTVRRKAAVIEAVRGGWMPIEEACELYSISVDEFGNAISIDMESTVCAPRDIIFTAILRQECPRGATTM
jgi:hypothetical protein